MSPRYFKDSGVWQFGHKLWPNCILLIIKKIKSFATSKIDSWQPFYIRKFSLQILTQLFYKSASPQAGIQELAGDATMLYYMTDEAQEGGKAFLEKRRPRFEDYPKFP